ncbi:PLC-like phosphodiesterase [Wolfiporia cocos MD-104 SS10]|uniref:Phosphoinositide phospholipase C n=1 Tax=Wolfiporia cocos (strain MD-104) TaxID=742152 RepID=A0A2H3JAI2_WOLCO|nr:PLC-like phosphodiesterase [Wolfiporia cocos MD-104 SS10]
MVDVTVPQLLQQGVPMLKVSAKKQKRYVFKLDPDQGQIVWESKKLRIIPIENIKELREGADARYYREQFQLAAHFEDRWLTIVYVLDGGYKTLHLIAGTHDVFQMWDITLRRLYAIRQKLMSGLGDTDVRQAVWEKQFWRSAAPDTGADQKLDFDEVERLCRRMNINPSREDLWARFTEADSMNRGYLDFADFQRFVKALKARPEIESLYKRLSAGYGGLLTYDAFERFMRTSQMSSLSQGELQRVFLRYASKDVELSNSAASSPAQNSLELAVKSAAIVEEPVRSSPSWDFDMHPSPSSSHSSATLVASSSSQSSSAFSLKSDVMSIKGFTTFLLSADNSAFADQHGKIYHDMSRPLPEYFVSSSHNTYLVGHQLVGESTIEGYIRALLHSCRSVELDIYDGDVEPVVYHGRTLTTKVLLRDACAAINKYAFVASPYPIIISAEIHCSVPQQELIASIMHEEFGEALLSAPIDGRPKIDVLPSPEDLKGRILLKAKNLYVSDKDDLREKEISVDTESSSTETSASDMDLADEAKQEWRRAREAEAELIKDLKYEFKKARNTFGRVRPHRTELAPNMSPSPRSDARDLPPANQAPQKVKMSFALVVLLVYTVGVKCRGLNKKEVYAPEHMFSLSESTANRILKHSMMDLIKHNKTHLVRIYPKGTRIGSTNFEPHRYWSAGAQLVAINWQTLDLGYMINHAMFQRNGRAGYVLKPLALRTADKQLMSHRSRHCFEVTVISAQQLPRPKNLLGREALDRSILDPYVEVSLHVPDWTQAHNHIHSSELSQGRARTSQRSPASAETGTSPATTSARTVTVRTAVVRNNGFNPVWDQQLSIPFDLVGDMRDLVFVRFAVKQEGAIDEEPLAIYCASMGSLNMGYRHLPLHDAQLSQYLFSTLFVKLGIHDL